MLIIYLSNDCLNYLLVLDTYNNLDFIALFVLIGSYWYWSCLLRFYRVRNDIGLDEKVLYPQDIFLVDANVYLNWELIGLRLEIEWLLGFLIKSMRIESSSSIDISIKYIT